jgi:predicted phage terminase large subunit-like protein
MPITTRILLHSNGPALWPEHKPVDEILELKATTPATIWEATYQGNPTAPEGVIFKREMFRHQRYDAASVGIKSQVVARFISLDTANKDKESNAFTAAAVGDLMSDYRLFVREVWRDRVQFPDLPPAIETLVRRHNHDGRLRQVIIEDKASGTSAYQTLMASSDRGLAGMLTAFQPAGDKEQRANQAAVWCANGSVWLPRPAPDVPWLVDFEDELFTFPGSEFADQVDAFSQLVIYCENLLAEGLHARLSPTMEDPS